MRANLSQARSLHKRECRWPQAGFMPTRSRRSGHQRLGYSRETPEPSVEATPEPKSRSISKRSPYPRALRDLAAIVACFSRLTLVPSYDELRLAAAVSATLFPALSCTSSVRFVHSRVSPRTGEQPLRRRGPVLRGLGTGWAALTVLDCLTGATMPGSWHAGCAARRCRGTGWRSAPATGSPRATPPCRLDRLLASSG